MNHGTWTPLMESLHGPAKARNEPDPTKVAPDAAKSTGGQEIHALPSFPLDTSGGLPKIPGSTSCTSKNPRSFQRDSLTRPHGPIAAFDKSSALAAVGGDPLPGTDIGGCEPRQIITQLEGDTPTRRSLPYVTRAVESDSGGASRVHNDLITISKSVIFGRACAPAFEPTMLILRDYQQQAREATHEALLSHHSTAIVAATGLGKTAIGATIINDRLPLGRALFIADRTELIRQAARALKSITGIEPDIEKAESWANEGMFKSPIIVSSIQTQVSGRNGSRRMHRFDPMEFATCFLDECDLAISPSYKELVAHYRKNPNLKIIGCTATPNRHDEQALGKLFESVAFNYGLVPAVQEGWLVKPRAIIRKLAELDLSRCDTTAGDLDKKDLREALQSPIILQKIARDAVEQSGARRTIVYCDSIENAEHVAEFVNRLRPGQARLVTGTTPDDERDGIIGEHGDFTEGRCQYLVNVGVATRGFDVPEVASIVMARPTKSETLYRQCVGRGTRTWPKCLDGKATASDRFAAIAASPKVDMVIVDFVGNAERLDLIHADDILGGDYNERTKSIVEKKMQESGAPIDVLAELESVSAELSRNDEIAARARREKGNVAKGRFVGKELDPFQIYGLTRRERRGWEPDAPAEASDLEKLRKWKLLKEGQLVSQADAAQLIEEVRARARRGKCTLPQARVLRKYGHEPDVSFDEAHAIIDAIAARGWTKR